MQPSPPDVVLTVPAAPGSVHLVRSVAAGAAATTNLAFDAVDDLRLAVDEACAVLLRLRGEHLRVRVWRGSDELTVAVSTDAEVDPWPDDDADGLSWKVIEGLTDDAGMARSDGGPEIWMKRQTRSVETR